MTSDRQIFLLSFLALFLELSWIRFLGSEVRIFAYLSNLLLLVCFLGLGYGAAIAHRTARMGLAYLASAALVLALIPDALAGRFALRRITEYLGGDPMFHSGQAAARASAGSPWRGSALASPCSS